MSVAPVPCGYGKLPVTVPADFLGLHVCCTPYRNNAFFTVMASTFPNTVVGNDPATVNYSWFRTHDNGNFCWYQIETDATHSPGVYNWTNIDTIITYHKAKGHKVLWTVLGTPSAYASSTDQARTFYDQAANYAGAAGGGGAGGGGGYPASASPNGLTALGNFITAMVTRYNTPGGAWGGYGTYGRGVNAIECWNEPGFGYPGFFWGSKGQLVDMCYTIRQAAKAVDAGITIVSPGFATNYAAVASYLTTAGVVNTTITGNQCFDVLAYHVYNSGLQDTYFSDLTNDIWSSAYGLKQWQDWLNNNGMQGTPIWVTETGLDYRNSSAALTLLNAQPASYRYQWWMRRLMWMAAAGIQRVFSYCWEMPFLCYPNADPQGPAQAINDFAARVAGKTITAASVVPGGAVSLTFSDGTALTV
jgi:hypothetical protein